MSIMRLDLTSIFVPFSFLRKTRLFSDVITPGSLTCILNYFHTFVDEDTERRVHKTSPFHVKYPHEASLRETSPLKTSPHDLNVHPSQMSPVTKRPS